MPVMPLANHFRHQDNAATVPTSPYQLRQPYRSPAAGSAEFRQRMQAVGRLYRQAGVSIICLVHGTFVGPDGLGILAELGRVFPAARAVCKRISKQVIDTMTGASGNYTAAYAETLRLGHGRLRTPAAFRQPPPGRRLAGVPGTVPPHA